MSTAMIAERLEQTAGTTTWLHFERPRPALAGLSPEELLERSGRLAGNCRHGSAGAEVVFLGEVRGRHSEGDPSAGLEEPAEVQAADTHGLEELAEAALEGAGLGWKRREGGWVVPAGGKLPREVRIAAEGAGVRVEAVLVEWDEVGPAEREAVARLLCRAQLGLRFARCELTPTCARVAARVGINDVEGALADSVGGVAAGCRLLAREVGALLVPEAARAFLEFLGVPAERAGGLTP
jgi:hypothetical protein